MATGWAAECALEVEDKRAALMSEEAAIVAVLAGDSKAFESIMRRHNRLMFRTARAILDDETDAEDVVQEAYIKAYTHLAQFSGRSRLATWLCRIAVNEALGRLRRRMPAVPFEDFMEARMAAGTDETAKASWASATASPEEETARNQMRALLEQAIDGLPRDQRAVFLLRAVEGFSTEETAECLSIPPDTVKTRLHRARKRLRSNISRRFQSNLNEVFPFAGARCNRTVAGVLARLEDLPPPG